ncbi:hypothetical protein F5884DRAFT_703502 [Xylogone sp. PMI_703]|nr:hypothetical protein F5884DRAFT_703502 [Xylogone sp. PMI_703]
MASTSQTILVTGASSFIAAHVLEVFFDAGYKIRGVVRSQSSADKVLKSHSKCADKLSFAIVEDMTKPGAFDEAVRGVEGVIHLQSPFKLEVEDNEKDLLIPAIQGTTGILESIQRHNASVKRVVITSSFASNLDLSKGTWPEHTYTEKDWNPATYDEAKIANAAFAYCASKSLAEKAAWKYVADKNPNFTLSVICPPVVFGPNHHYVDDLTRLNESSTMFYNLMKGSTKEVPPTGFWAVVDVRDVALAHKLAYEKAEAAGQRYLTTSGSFSFDQVCNILNEELPELRSRVPQADPNYQLPPVYKVDNSKSRSELGISYRPLREIVVDTARNILELEKKLQQA